MAQEFWRWTESRWTDPDKDWKKAKIITAGVDVGSVSSQAVVMADGGIICYANMRTGSDSPNSATNAMNWALEGTGLTLEKIQYTVGTGYGRVNVPFSQRAITEIACHARAPILCTARRCAPCWTWAARTARPSGSTKRAR